MKAYLEIEMPTNCAHCMMWSICPALPNGEWPDYESILTNDVIGDGGAVPGIRHLDCPLIPIPPHGDLIDRDALMKILSKVIDINASIEQRNEATDQERRCLWWFEQQIGIAPTVIPAEEGEA